MNVSFDAVMISVYLHPTAKAPKPVANLPERIQLLIDELEAAGAKIIIATPVLSEFLVMAGPKDGPVYLTELTTNDVFDIKHFDIKAAVEAAEMQRKAMAAGDKRAGSPSRWQVVKVDRQLVAIAKANNVQCIYSDDAGVRKLAEAEGIECKGIDDLPLPAVDPQTEFEFETPKPAASPSTATAPPFVRSLGDGKVKATSPAPRLRAVRQAAPKRRQQGSSPAAPKPPRTKK